MNNSFLKNITVVLPSLDPDYRLNLVVEGVLAQGFTDIVIVNDGSDEVHAEPFAKALEHPEVTVLTHEVNKGKGRGLKTAFEFVKDNRKDAIGVVTIDGDNQHHPEDIKACALKMAETDSVVLGCRDFSLPEVPWKSKCGNNITRFVFRAFCGIKISDTQTGLRAVPYKYLQDMLDTEGERFEYETNMLLEIKSRNIPLTEVKIRTLYEDKENSTSHFHPFRDSMKIYKVIFKYLFSSGTSSVIDLGAFFILSVILGLFVKEGFAAFGKTFSPDYIIVFLATAVSRAISSVFNYKMNKHVVFKSESKGSLGRYYLLAVLQLCVSALCVSALSTFFGAKSLLKTVLKALVDFALFFVSFRIQKAWVFSTKKYFK